MFSHFLSLKWILFSVHVLDQLTSPVYDELVFAALFINVCLCEFHLYMTEFCSVCSVSHLYPDLPVWCCWKFLSHCLHLFLLVRNHDAVIE